MNNFKLEEKFFHDINKEIRNLINKSLLSNKIAKNKGHSSDYATEIDISVEKTIVKYIKNNFKDDEILAEENHSNQLISNKRIWIIDPICGTSNLGRNIKMYCTNIALAINKKVVCACVIDHSNDNYYWSSGNNKIFINNLELKKDNKDVGVKIEVDFGATLNLSNSEKLKHNKVVGLLSTTTNYEIVSYNTSLSLATYIAIGKIDGSINFFTKPWDIAAGAFLIQQSGGIITNLHGKPWSLLSPSFIAAKNKEIHQILLNIYNKA